MSAQPQALEQGKAEATLNQTTTIDVSKRLMCLDIYRGLMVAGMILVDNPGSDEGAYWPIKHAKWNGYTR